MPKTDNAQVPLRDLFEQIDQMRTILKLVDGGFKVPVGPVMASLSPSDIQGLKTQYTQLISKMQQTARSFPDATSYFP